MAKDKWRSRVQIKTREEKCRSKVVDEAEGKKTVVKEKTLLNSILWRQGALSKDKANNSIA